MKKPYDKPSIIHTEKLEARAVVCSKADASCDTSGGVIAS